MGTRSWIGTSRTTAAEGPAKGLLLPDREEAKGLLLCCRRETNERDCVVCFAAAADCQVATVISIAI